MSAESLRGGIGTHEAVLETCVCAKGRDGVKAGCTVKAVFLTSVTPVSARLASTLSLLLVCCAVSAKTQEPE